MKRVRPGTVFVKNWFITSGRLDAILPANTPADKILLDTLHIRNQ
jgi:hypothetical protein